MSIFDRLGGLKEEQTMGPYEFLARKRILFLYAEMVPFPMRGDPFNAVSVADLILAFDNEDHEKPVRLVIDSPGGMVHTGFTLYDTIKSVQCPVYTIGRSCQSMAALILAAGTKGHRYVYPNCRVMLHLPSGVATGDTKDVKIQQMEMEFLTDSLATSLIDCGVQKKRLQVLKDIDREFWMGAKEAIVYGIADKVIEGGLLDAD